VVVGAFLHDKTPLMAKLDLTDSLGAPRTVDLACRRTTFLGRAGVLNTAAVTDQVIPRGLTNAVIGRTELDNAVPLLFTKLLDVRKELLKRHEDGIRWWRKCC